jgi:hypothetical protein
MVVNDGNFHSGNDWSEWVGIVSLAVGQGHTQGECCIS